MIVQRLAARLLDFDSLLACAVRGIAAFVLAAGLCGCAKIGLWFSADKASEEYSGLSNPQPPPIAAGEQEAQLPLELAIAQAFVKDDTLNVKLYVKAKTEIPTDQVAISVLGLREGEVVEEQKRFLSEVLSSNSIKAGERASVLFALNNQGLTEYQARLSWGRDARTGNKRQDSSMPDEEEISPAPAKEVLLGSHIPEGRTLSAAPEPEGRVELLNIELEQSKHACEFGACDRLYTVLGDLVNNSTEVVSSTTLLLGLYWSDEGQSPAVPGPDDPPDNNEELIELENLNLSPGESQPIRITIDRPIPVVPGGRFLPHLRLFPENLESRAL